MTSVVCGYFLTYCHAAYFTTHNKLQLNMVDTVLTLPNMALYNTGIGPS